MLYEPPGTGKLLLCMAIASEFNLPVYCFNLMEMTDNSLHTEFQDLPKRSLVLFEEMDTAGIVRKNTMNTETDASDDETEDEEDEKEAAIKPKKKKQSKKAKKPEPDGSKVTLGGLLNVLDGPGAKEGRLVICTTNSPYSLDESLVRPGRIDKRIFLGKSSKLVAAITFTRIFGTDPRLKGKLKKQDMNRMAKEFGDAVPNNKFTPCEIQQFCMSWRGKPERAIKEMPQWAKDRLRWCTRLQIRHHSKPFRR
jgi:chaperone BCS1